MSSVGVNGVLGVVGTCCVRLHGPLANNRFTTKCGQFSSNLRPITPIVGIYQENKLTFTPREV